LPRRSGMGSGGVARGETHESCRCEPPRRERAASGIRQDFDGMGAERSRPGDGVGLRPLAPGFFACPCLAPVPLPALFWPRRRGGARSARRFAATCHAEAAWVLAMWLVAKTTSHVAANLLAERAASGIRQVFEGGEVRKVPGTLVTWRRTGSHPLCSQRRPPRPALHLLPPRSPSSLLASSVSQRAPRPRRGCPEEEEEPPKRDQGKSRAPVLRRGNVALASHGGQGAGEEPLPRWWAISTRLAFGNAGHGSGERSRAREEGEEGVRGRGGNGSLALSSPSLFAASAASAGAGHLLPPRSPSSLLASSVSQRVPRPRRGCPEEEEEPPKRDQGKSRAPVLRRGNVALASHGGQGAGEEPLPRWWAISTRLAFGNAGHGSRPRSRAREEGKYGPGNSGKTRAGEKPRSER